MATHAGPIRTPIGSDARRRTEEDTLASLSSYADASPREVSKRLEELDREWDTDRVLEVESAATGLLGLTLGALFGPRLLLLPATVAGAVLVHARTGRYPLMPLFRRLGIRTGRAIARERYSLKALRGDFNLGSGTAAAASDSTKDTSSTAASGTLIDRLPPTTRRVQWHTSGKVNAAVRERTEANVEELSDAPVEEIDSRLDELEDEWDIERVLQANASIVSLLGITLGAIADRRFLALPAAVFGFFAQHAVQGWCPPIPIFRRIGVRTRQEIERERYALKALRGDFDALRGSENGKRSERVRAVLAAVDA